MALNQEELKKILSVRYLIQIEQILPAVFLPPVIFPPVILGQEEFYGLVHYTTKPRLRRGQSCRLSSSNSSTALVHAQTDPAATSRHSDCLSACRSASLYYYHSDCCLVSFALDKHFISKKSPASALTFPFAETEQSFINHTTKCKISKLFDIAGLMK